MKKCCFMFIAMVILIFTASVAVADVPDMTGMTDAELMDVIDMARYELTRREAKTEDGSIILYDKDGIFVYLTGSYRVSTHYLYLGIVGINNSDIDVFVTIPPHEYAVVNGWQTYVTVLGTVKAGMKKNGELCIDMEDAGIKSYEELEDMHFTFAIMNDRWVDTIYDSKDMFVSFK
ncbi:MAG: hypothetical protein CW338_02760 [Clostridiales bacterium]|nr:hypothetical protein [Clostridiales bacterium]